MKTDSLVVSTGHTSGHSHHQTDHTHTLSMYVEPPRFLFPSVLTDQQYFFNFFFNLVPMLFRIQDLIIIIYSGICNYIKLGEVRYIIFFSKYFGGRGGGSLSLQRRLHSYKHFGQFFSLFGEGGETDWLHSCKSAHSRSKQDIPFWWCIMLFT